MLGECTARVPPNGRAGSARRAARQRAAAGAHRVVAQPLRRRGRGRRPRPACRRSARSAGAAARSSRWPASVQPRSSWRFAIARCTCGSPGAVVSSWRQTSSAASRRPAARWTIAASSISSRAPAMSPAAMSAAASASSASGSGGGPSMGAGGGDGRSTCGHACRRRRRAPATELAGLMSTHAGCVPSSAMRAARATSTRRSPRRRGRRGRSSIGEAAAASRRATGSADGPEARTRARGVAAARTRLGGSPVGIDHGQRSLGRRREGRRRQFGAARGPRGVSASASRAARRLEVGRRDGLPRRPRPIGPRRPGRMPGARSRRPRRIGGHARRARGARARSAASSSGAMRSAWSNASAASGQRSRRCRTVPWLAIGRARSGTSRAAVRYASRAPSRSPASAAMCPRRSAALYCSNRESVTRGSLARRRFGRPPPEVLRR